MNINTINENIHNLILLKSIGPFKCKYFRHYQLNIYQFPNTTLSSKFHEIPVLFFVHHWGTFKMFNRYFMVLFLMY